MQENKINTANLEGLAAIVLRDRKEAITQRTEHEQRWLDDIRQWSGQYDDATMTEIKNSGGSQVFVNITQQKCNAAESRLSEMVLPYDGRTWGIDATPVPTMPNVDPTQAKAMAERAAELMADEIDDQLAEADHIGKSRSAIRDLVIYGTAVMKAPQIVGKTRKAWQQVKDDAYSIEQREDITAGVKHVSIHNFFPDMSAPRVDQCRYINERDFITGKQLASLKGIPGYIAENIELAIEDGFKESQSDESYLDDLRNIDKLSTIKGSKLFELWEYHGAVSADDLQAAGIEIGERSGDIEVVILMVGDHIIRVSINPMQTGDRPYSVSSWLKSETCLFGYGVPYTLRDIQRMINAAWRAMMDNAGLSAAPQIVVNGHLIEPADGDWTMKPRKTWKAKSKNVNVREAFVDVQITTNQAELQAILGMLQAMADEVSNLPKIAQGEGADRTAGHTALGMSMLLNNSNIMLRKAVKNWDDNMTRPTIRRFYDWNMQFNSKPEIKGDFEVRTRGTSELLLKETQAQALMMLSQTFAGLPQFAQNADWRGMQEELVKATQVDSDKVLLDAEQVKANQQNNPPQPAPEVQVAQIEQQTALAKYQAEQQQFGAKQQADMQEQSFQHQAQMQELMLQREIKLLELASKENMTLTELQAKLNIEIQKIEQVERKNQIDAAVKVANATGRQDPIM
ncbi:hypothetical protein TW81_02200 [Vibrio galatheae]|uniref:Portal protein n=1 Tax=Vibrio galatheae TaxID=579748 RepID=A0A0F4NRV4_9VIBR|nr:cell envelope integrity protein TolA [Vibrio galatheae]KJY84826.1 hypothetical protein TW81_02200 [Vibrio galatheae]